MNSSAGPATESTDNQADSQKQQMPLKQQQVPEQQHMPEQQDMPEQQQVQQLPRQAPPSCHEERAGDDFLLFRQFQDYDDDDDDADDDSLLGSTNDSFDESPTKKLRRSLSRVDFRSRVFEKLVRCGLNRRDHLRDALSGDKENAIDGKELNQAEMDDPGKTGNNRHHGQLQGHNDPALQTTRHSTRMGSAHAWNEPSDLSDSSSRNRSTFGSDSNRPNLESSRQEGFGLAGKPGNPHGNPHGIRFLWS